jgi:hypothetical protein
MIEISPRACNRKKEWKVVNFQHVPEHDEHHVTGNIRTASNGHARARIAHALIGYIYITQAIHGGEYGERH